MSKYGKYVFPTREKAQEMKESLNGTEDKPNPSEGFALLPEMTKAVIDEETNEVLEEAVPTGRFQLDVIWRGLKPEPKEDENDIDVFDHPYGWKMYSIDISHEGNNVVNGFSYLSNKF